MARLASRIRPAATHGLGMKIIAALVKQIHGELNFAKGDHDQGTRFSVLFSRPENHKSQCSLYRHRRAGCRRWVAGYQLYQERQKSSGVEINIGKGGISIEKK